MNGRVIAGRYRITAQLGAGGMGSVWRAQHLSLGSPVAVKLIDEAIAKNPEVLVRFEREAQAAANLRSPHVVQVLDYGVDDGTPFIAMELLDGESLEERLLREGRLSVENTVSLMTQVGRAIAKAHEAGITHRDLKPANIFLVRNDDEVVAKVLDFGIAKTQGPAGSATRTGHMIGTPAYMSPEQAQGNKSVDGRTDLWAMAVITFECLLGRMVFEGDAIGDLILQICAKPIPIPSQLGDVPPGFDDWFGRATARAPESRFQTPKEFIDSLRVATGLSLPSAATGPHSALGPTLRGLGPDSNEPAPVSVRVTPPSQPAASFRGGDVSVESAVAIESARTVSAPAVEAASPEGASPSGGATSIGNAASTGDASPSGSPRTAGTFTTSMGVPVQSRRGPLLAGTAAIVLVAAVVGSLQLSKRSDSSASSVATTARSESLAQAAMTSATTPPEAATSVRTTASGPAMDEQPVVAPPSAATPGTVTSTAPTNTAAPHSAGGARTPPPAASAGRPLSGKPALPPPPSMPSGGDDRVGF